MTKISTPMTPLAEHPVAKRRDNRLADIDGVAYVWDAKGNLIQAGNRALAYDHANRLIEVSHQGAVYEFSYNGLGDRLAQSFNGAATQYTLDLNAGLTQVLADNDNTYLYGLSRVGQQGSAGWSYHLPDALGSVRQMADPNAAGTFAQSYEPYGNVLEVAGEARTPYGFAGEWMDRTGLVHLRARYYAPYFGTFIQPDPWPGSPMIPDTLHPYLYAGANPVVYSDPSGRCWGPIEFLRDTALYGQTCSNMDMAWTITTSSQATVGQRAIAASYLTVEGISHSVAIGGSALACLGGGCQAIGGAIGGALSTELLTYGTMTYIGLDAVFIAMDLGAIGYDTYLLISSGSCADEQLRAKLFADVVGLGLDLVAPGLGRGTSGGLRLAAQGGQAAAGALDVARASATVRSLQSVYKILQLGGPTILMAASSSPDAGEDVRSSIDTDKRLVKEAESAGRSHQNSLDRLVDQLSQGNMNPGIGTKRLFGSVFEARARDGARVYFRGTSDGIIEILAKSSKSNQSRVINILREIYGP